MAGLFKKIAKTLLIGGGTVLSLFAPVIGAPLMVAGMAIQTDSDNKTIDKVSTYAANLEKAKSLANTMGTSGNANILWNNILSFLQKNFIYVIAGAGALFILPKLLRTRKRKR
jgi:hypothetical protein